MLCPRSRIQPLEQCAGETALPRFLLKSLQGKIFTNTPDWYESLKMEHFQFLLRDKQVQSSDTAKGRNICPSATSGFYPPFIWPCMQGIILLEEGEFQHVCTPGQLAHTPLPPPNPQDRQASIPCPLPPTKRSSEYFVFF